MAQRGRWLGCVGPNILLALMLRQLKRDGGQLTLPSIVKCRLENLNVLCLPTFGATLHVEADCLTFLQRTIPVRLDGREVNENVFAVLA